MDPNCAAGMPFDVSGNPCIDECARGMPYDSNGNPCGASVYDIQYGSPGVVPTAAGYEHTAAQPLQPAVTKFPLTISLPGGPSPRVSVPLSSSSVGMFLSSGNLLGVPVWEWLAVGAVLLVLPGLVGGRRRR